MKGRVLCFAVGPLAYQCIVTASTAKDSPGYNGLWLPMGTFISHRAHFVSFGRWLKGFWSFYLVHRV